MTARIPTYFSHSYWAEDREVNKHFWKLFWDAGFAFTVDPRSGTLSIPHIELLLRRSACFVAVVTYRPEVHSYLTSPYLVFEYGLAVQANKPRLVFVERPAARHPYEDDRRLVFDRDALADHHDRHVSAIAQLRDMSIGHAHLEGRERGSVGLLLPRDGAYRAAMPAIREVLGRAGYEVVVLDHDTPNPYKFIVEVDRHDFLLIDVGEGELPPWLHPVLYGRFVPMVRLLHYEMGSRPARSLPRLLLGHAIELVASGDELAIWWSGVDELIPKLEREVRALRQRPRGEFRTLEQGVGYFNSLGRSVDATVFVSNAGTENETARELCCALRDSYVRFFHYVHGNTIELGEPWLDGLRGKLESSQLFVPLINAAYWESETCKEEWRVAEELRARGRLRVIPYFLEPSGSLPPQGRLLYTLPAEQWVDRIMLDVDSYLTPRSIAADVSQSWWRAENEPQVDVAFVTVAPDEYDAVLRHLDWHHPVQATETRPNPYAWTFGQVTPADGGRPHRVVLGLAADGYAEASVLIVRRTIEAFRPRYVLLVGAAGGLNGTGAGDVVVASRIYGYECGAAGEPFRPRPDWNYPTDSAVVNAALAMPGLHPGWSEGQVAASVARGTPRVVVGPVASGNRTIDQPWTSSFQPVVERWPELLAVEVAGLGAAEVIKDARERGHIVNFGMVRGITGSLRPPDANGGFQDRTAAGWAGAGGGSAAAADAAAALAVQMIRLAWPRAPRT
jgi:nucleoside phosphorylase